MAYKLYQLLLDTYLELGQGMKAAATGGGTGTVVDTKLSGTNQEFKDWTIFIAKTTDGLAPQGQFRRVKQYDDGTFTIEPAWDAGAEVQAGDEYILVSTLYPALTLIDCANKGLQKLGSMTLVDTTTITAENVYEYPYNVAWKRTRPLRVDVAQEKTGDHRWAEVSPAFWEYEPSLPGVAGKLIFRIPLTAGYEVRVWYEGVHPELSNYNDVVSETIPENVAWLSAAHQALVWQNGRQQGGEPYLLQKENAALQNLENAKVNWVVWKPRRKSKLMVVK